MEGIQYVYFEKVVLINLAMNGLILWTAGRLSRVEIRLWRLTGAGLIGALYSLVLLFPSLHWAVSFAAKMLMSLLMIWIAFYPVPRSKLWRVLIFFYLASFAMGGAVIGLGSLVGLAVLGRHLWWLLPLVAAGGLAYGYWAPALGRLVQEAFGRIQIKIGVDGKEEELIGLVDTGNQVRDPVSQDPVVIVEIAAIGELLPSEVREAFAGKNGPNSEPWELISALTDTSWAARWRVVPYRSVGRDGGILLGFRPDYLEICRGNELVREQRVVVGLYQQPLSGDGSYRAILPADWLIF